MMNGSLLPAGEARISITDHGLVQGLTVTERVRTFRHRPYLLDEHLQRLRRSLELSGIAPASLVDDVPDAVAAVVAHNASLIDKELDLSIIIFVTAGPNPALAGLPTAPESQTVCVHTVPLPAPSWASLAENGVRLMTPLVRQIPADVIPAHIKHRSRLHWFLAEKQVRQVDSEASALLLNREGNVTETATGNLMIYDGERLITPHPADVLDGISRRVVTRLAAGIGIDTIFADITTDEVVSASEALLTSTGYCLLPVTRLNGRPVGEGRPGPLFQRLLEIWSGEVGVDIAQQHRRTAA